MNRIDEIALRVAGAYEALSSIDDCARMDIGVDAMGPRKVLEQFIADVEKLAELSKNAEPVGYRYVDHNGHWCFNEMKFGDIAEPVYSHPAPVIASEQKPVDINDKELAERLFVAWQSTEFAECDGEYTYKRLSDGFTDSYVEAWLKVARMAKAVTSPPNTADIEQRVAEAVAHWIRCGDHHGVITSDDVLAGKWREYQ